PKGALLSHGNFFWANLNMIVNSEITHDEVSLVVLPMFHIGGWNVNTLAVFLKGGTVVLERVFDAGRALKLIPKKKVTLLMGVPATYLFMSQQPGFEDADFSSVRTMVVGGAPMPEALLETYAARGIAIVQGYGLTELAPNALLLPARDAGRKLGSAGKPYFFSDTRLADDQGDPIEGEGVGEVIARGPIVMSGYYKREDATAETIRKGWLHTGDVARRDDEGYFFIVDRKKDMIISGGENIYPAEIENTIYQHPDVGEVAVVGVPDEKWGESPHAIVIPKEGKTLTEADVIAFCRERLAKFKVPRSVTITSSALPRTPAGKVRKPELRAPYWDQQKKNI
ncbi:MAG: AMP-binding protein, partial [Acidimicrobiia bacterium]